MKKHAALFLLVVIFSGCGGAEYSPPARMPKKRVLEEPPEIPEMQEYSYRGGSFRDPFARSAAGPQASGEKAPSPIPDPGSLRLAGSLCGPLGKFALITGPAESYLVRGGRVYNENDQEVPGVSAAFGEDKVLLITEDDEVFELEIP